MFFFCFFILISDTTENLEDSVKIIRIFVGILEIFGIWPQFVQGNYCFHSIGIIGNTLLYSILQREHPDECWDFYLTNKICHISVTSDSEPVCLLLNAAIACLHPFCVLRRFSVCERFFYITVPLLCLYFLTYLILFCAMAFSFLSLVILYIKLCLLHTSAFNHGQLHYSRWGRFLAICANHGFILVFFTDHAAVVY